VKSKPGPFDPDLDWVRVEEQKNIRLILAYDGGRYHGWQRQKGASTVQETIESKLRVMTGQASTLIASGRTDAGVHALNQVCHFLTKSKIDPHAMKRGLNALLPGDILIKAAAYAPLDFHARYHVKTKTYEYRILNRPEPDLFRRHYTWHIPVPLDLKAMERCLTSLTGKHDFTSFRSTGSGNTNPVREIIRAGIDRPAEDALHLFFEADGFLRHMVRNIVGTVVEVGRKKTGFEKFIEIFQSKDRRQAGIKAPPQGLFLTSVTY
jgi:tRNA pseudouridine38-40 synthase